MVVFAKIFLSIKYNTIKSLFFFQKIFYKWFNGKEIFRKCGEGKNKKEKNEKIIRDNYSLWVNF